MRAPPAVALAAERVTEGPPNAPKLPSLAPSGRPARGPPALAPLPREALSQLLPREKLHPALAQLPAA